MKNKIWQIIIILYWMTFLIGTDSYYLVYLLLGGVAIGWTLFGGKRDLEASKGPVTGIFATVFSLMVILSNYKLVLEYYGATGKYFWILYTAVSTLALLLGGILVYKSLINAGIYGISHVKMLGTTDSKEIDSTFKFWLVSFAGISLFYLIILFIFNYPGIVSPDAVHQLRMIRDNEYSTHHPLLHTLLIRLFYGIGHGIFGTPNAGIAFYSVFQILCASATIAYMGVTVYEMGIGRKRAMWLVALTAILPYNIEYSASMRKDTLFGCLVLIAVISFYRIVRKFSASKLSHVMFVLGVFGIGTFRNNGIYVMLACIVVAAVVVFFRHKEHTSVRLLIIAVIATIAAMITLPLLKTGLNATDTDDMEKLAIPIQQIARVIVDECEIDESDRALLTNIADFDGIKSSYQDNFVDPVKDYIRHNGDPDFITEHKKELASLYVRWIGKYPGEFVKAWIDQTRGYYNGGYKYWRWEHGISDNDLGISRSYPSEAVFRLINEYLWLWQTVPILLPVLCIGLTTWLLMMSLNIAIIQKKKAEALMTLPALFNIGTLLIATPVFAEFRYAYPSFMCIPFIILVMSQICLADTYTSLQE